MCPMVQNDERMVLPDNYQFMKAKTRHGNNNLKMMFNDPNDQKSNPGRNSRCN